MEITIDEALKQAVSAHRNGKLQEAEKLYKAILNTNPKHPDANHNLGVLAVGVGRTNDSLGYFQAALEANSKIDQYWFSYIDALLKLGYIDGARQALLSGKKAGLKGEKADKIEAQLAIPSLSTLSSSNNEEFDRLVALYHKGEYREVIVHGKALVSQFPTDPFFRNVLGVACSAEAICAIISVGCLGVCMRLSQVWSNFPHHFWFSSTPSL